MSGFKLLAIRPLKGCDQKYSKNLELGRVYQFYHDYKFEITVDSGGKETVSITHTPTVPEELYNITTANENPISVSISAVVGKNGSGKSALFELHYGFCCLIAIQAGLIKDRPDNNTMTNHQIRLFGDIDYLKGNLKVEIYITTGSFVFKCIANGVSLNFQKKAIQNLEKEWEVDENFDLSSFFYSIALNYSIFGLNSTTNLWLDSLFHKNDGYQTPLVINPYRESGEIYVNNEYKLAQARLLNNLSFNGNPEILKGKFLDQIHFVFNPLSLLELDKLDFGYSIRKYSVTKAIQIFDRLYFAFTKTTFHQTDKARENLVHELINIDGKRYLSSNFKIDFSSLENLMIKYVIYKVFKLCLKDADLREKHYQELKDSDGIAHSIKNEDGLIEYITENNSHLTLKIRQIIFAIFTRIFDRNIHTEDNSTNNQVRVEFVISFRALEFSNIQKSNKVKYSSLINDQLELIPNAFAKIELGIIHENKSNSNIQSLSSGEQQLIFTLQTIYYHLYNINSVVPTSKKKKYSFVNIMLDEIELYFHPEYQRNFVNELMRGVTKLNIEKINSLNILFSTHSPFILSDIPSQNVLRLKDGKPYEESQKGTFGANVHDLLHDSFFMEDGFMGKFATEKINEVIKRINYEKLTLEIDRLDELINNSETVILDKESWSEEKRKLEIRRSELYKEKPDISIESCINLVELIGEPAIQNKLCSMISSIKSQSETIAYLNEIQEIKKKYGKL